MTSSSSTDIRNNVIEETDKHSKDKVSNLSGVGLELGGDMLHAKLKSTLDSSYD